LYAVQAKTLGAVLISAMNWEREWRNQAGHYLAGTPEQIKPEVPEMPEEIVLGNGTPIKDAPIEDILHHRTGDDD
jgi:hypothetical protein